MNIEVDFHTPNLMSGYVWSSFNRGKATLEERGYRVISLEENAFLRIQSRGGSNVLRNTNRTRECFVYNPNEKVWLLSKVSPIMENPWFAVEAHRNNEEFFANDEQFSRMLEDSIRVNDKLIPCSRFSEDSFTAYAFGKYAEEYGRFLIDVGIHKMPIKLIDYFGDEPIVKQVEFGGLIPGINSAIIGATHLDLDHDLERVRGIKEIFKSKLIL